MKIYIMVVFCLKRQMSALVDEYSDWQPEGAKVQHYGHTQKVTDGYIVIHWSKTIPMLFVQKLYEDQDVIDYLVYDENLQPLAVEQA